MDTRVILNRPRIQDLASIPELDGVAAGTPELKAAGPAVHRAEISLIVPTFFNQELKRASLELVLANIERSACVAEVILVCSDGEHRQFEELRSLLGTVPLRVVEAPPHQRGRSRNIGAEAASKPWLLFLDDDMILRDWRLVDVILSEAMAGEFEAALFPRRHYARFPLLYDCACLEENLGLWRSGGQSAFLFDPLQEGTGDLPMIFCFPGCFMLIREGAFQKIGGFSEEFLGWGFEDTHFALKAIRGLRVLNLFRKSEPLLHVDHPVSPYKSEEHQENWKKFYGSPGAVDIHRFCRTVFAGENFVQAASAILGREIHIRPLEALRRKGVPLDPVEAFPWICGVADSLMERFSSPVPEFGILHGSQATGRSRIDSDYDVLLLYRGAVQDFFVSRTEPRVETECASLQTFATLAEQPCLYDHRAVLELAKIAQGKLLFGNVRRWEHWKSGVLQSAVKEGVCFWLVMGIGLNLAAEKHGLLVRRYFRSLEQIASAAGLTLLAHSNTLHAHSVYARAALDDLLPHWREAVADNRKVFPLQVPEVWQALHWLAKAKTGK
jgi:hypothetical protein